MQNHSVKFKSFAGRVQLAVILLIIGIIAVSLVYSRIMTLIATKFIGEFLCQELGETMGKAVVIRKVSWSPLGKITLYGAKLATLDKANPIPIIEAEKIQTDLTVWDVFFKKIRRPLGKIVFIKPRLYFGAGQQSFLAFYNPLKKGGIRRLILPRLYIQEGEVMVLEPERKTYFSLKSISGFIDPAIPVRTRISLKGTPDTDEYASFDFRGTLNLLTLAHNLKLDWQGLKLSTLRNLIGGVEFKDGFADVNLKLERRREYADPWAGYVGWVKIHDGVARLKSTSSTPVRFEGIFELKGKDFLSEKFLAYLGGSKLSAGGRLFFFGEPEMDISFISEELEIEDILGISNFGTSSGAKGRGKIALRIFGKMDNPAIRGEIDFPEVRVFSSHISDISSSFSGHIGELNLEKFSMRLCDGYFTAEGRVSENTALNFDLKEAKINEICNMLAYSGVMANPVLRNYSSQLKGEVDLTGMAKGGLKGPYISGFFTGRNIETGSQLFDKVEARFEYNTKGLKFNPLVLGKEYRIWSEFNSSDEGKELELILQIDDANLEALVRDLGINVPSPFTGRVSGEVEFKGEVEKIKSRGHLAIRRGEISNIRFEEMNLVFQGLGREIDIEDSSISQEKGKILIMRGKFLLGDKAKNVVELKPSDRGFVWEGWNIEKDPDQMEFNMGRNISNNWYLSFSTPVDNIHKYQEVNRPPRPDNAQKAELQYRLDDERRLKLHWKDKEEFIGLEQKFKF